mgnify:CR=1 FL=1
MSSQLLLGLIAAYFLLLIAISYFSGRKSDNETFFTGNRQSPWYVVAFGMVGASLSGVTFISVPGWVATNGFSYMQMVLGYVLGYIVIVNILLPLYYRLNLTSIYTYLGGRFGNTSYKTGSLFFLLSRIIGASFRLYLVAIVLDQILAVYEVPFWLTVAITILLIWVYTFRSGIKTIVWTDTLQTTFMLLAVIITVFVIRDKLIPEEGLFNYIAQSDYSTVFNFGDWRAENAFWKQFLAGMFITIVMTGLDQDMMQKNLSCRSLKDAQKNMMWLSVVLVFVNVIFLSLGVLLYDYAAAAGIDATGDKLFSAVALSGDLGMLVAGLFVVGLIAAAYSSADSALTALTTSFCVDILGVQKMEAQRATQLRKVTHIGFSLVLFLVIILFKYWVDDSVIKELFTIAGYTYGPLLGLYAFGLITKLNIKDVWVPVVCIVSPLLCYFFKIYALEWWGYSFSFELLLLNGLLTFMGLLLLVDTKKAAYIE